MYINKILYENVGPITKIDIDASFTDAGNPKPMLLVGENGSGKSTLLSNIVDSFYEMAGEAFGNVKQLDGGTGHQYYKAIMPIEIHSGEKCMYSYIEYQDTKKIAYISKCGNLSVDEVKNKIGTNVARTLNLRESVNCKGISAGKEDVKRIWEKDIVCYFGPDRYEKPIWMGNKYYETEEFSHPTIKQSWNGYLDNPIVVRNVTSINLPWLLDVIVDSRPDVKGDKNNLSLANISATDLIELRKARENLEVIMSKIIGEDVYFGLNLRNSGKSRFKILKKSDDSVVAPSIDSLSTGQIALFNMFSTIVRYADNNRLLQSINLEEITGIAVIDEIELHLHTKLQRETLPQLIKLFPKVQFIITTHAPLFLLGMQENFGDENFDIYELPDALKIDVERFVEFQRAYDYFKQTKTYQQDAEKILSEIETETHTLVITEGATDWKHMKAAYNSLKENENYAELLAQLDFEFIEYEPKNSHDDAKYKLEMGNTTLSAICENMAKFPQETRYIFIADRDHEATNRKLGGFNSDYKDWGNNVYSFVLPIPDSRSETPNICIEHFYSDAEIKTEIEIDGVKRRLYLGNEFDNRGIAYSINRSCERKDICGQNSIAIIEGTQGDRVTDLENASNINYALPKMKFANFVLDKQHPFDDFNFENFVEIFKIIKEIIDANS